MKDSINTIAKIFGSEFILKIALGLTTIMIARYISTESYVVLFYFLTITNLCVNISSFFFNKLTFSLNNKTYIEKFGNTSTLFVLIMISFFIQSLILFINPLSSFYLYVLSFIIILVRIIFLYHQTLLQLTLSFRRIYIRESMRVCLYSFPVVFYLIFVTKYQVENIIMIQILSFIISELVFFDKSKFSFRVDNSIKILAFFFNKENKSIFLFTIALLFISSINVIMLKVYSDTVQLANYGASFTLYSFLMLGLTSVKKFILPKAAASKISEFEGIIYPVMKIGFMLIPFFIVGLFFSEQIFDIIYGKDKFQGSYIIFNILAFSAILSFFFSPYSSLLNTTGHFNFQLKSCLLGVIFLSSLNYFFIPLYGAKAAALSNLVVSFMINFSFFIKAKTIIKSSVI